MTSDGLIMRLMDEADQWDEPKSADEVDMRGLLHEAAAEIARLQEEYYAQYHRGYYEGRVVSIDANNG